MVIWLHYCGVKVRFRYHGWGAFVQNQAAYFVVVRKQRE